MRSVDLVNWALRTSPKFTTGVKYELQQGFWPDQRSGNPSHPSPPWTTIMILNCLCFYFFSLVYFLKKKRLIKWVAGEWVCVCECVCVCVSVCMSVVSFGPPNNFQTSYPIDTKFRLHIVSYRNSPTVFIPFLNYENCAREKFLKIIFSPFN